MHIVFMDGLPMPLYRIKQSKSNTDWEFIGRNSQHHGYTLVRDMQAETGNRQPISVISPDVSSISAARMMPCTCDGLRTPTMAAVTAG